MECLNMISKPSIATCFGNTPEKFIFIVFVSTPFIGPSFVRRERINLPYLYIIRSLTSLIIVFRTDCFNIFNFLGFNIFVILLYSQKKIINR